MILEKAAEVEIETLSGFALLMGYTVFINALLEEYVWRWFVFRQCEVLVGSGAAVFLGSALFTIHHVWALMVWGSSAWAPWQGVVLGSLGVFIGGVVWSWLYRRYRSVWVPYVSHIFADLGIVVMGYWLFFVAEVG